MVKLKDPVDVTGKQDEELLESQLGPEGVEATTGGLDESEIGAIPPGAARTAHPFEGYPLARNVKVGETEVSATYIVLLRNPEAVYQDPSGKGVTHSYFEKNAKGNDIRMLNQDGKLGPPKVARTERIDIKTYHNRVTVNPVTNDPMDTVFDRYVQVGQKMRTCAIVKDHAARASICFLINNKGKVEVDPRYELADPSQAGRLRKTFDMVNYQQMKAERLAQQFDAEPEAKPEQ